MAGGLSTFDGLYRQLLLRCPSASLMLARSWIDFAFRYFWDYKLWSWQRKQGQYIFDAAVNTGTVDATRGQFTIVGHGTAWTTDLVSHQFRVGLMTPIYTIASVADTTHLDLTAVWGAPTALGTTYFICNAYQTARTDFQNHVAIYDPRYNWALALGVTQEELDVWDAQRANIGNTSYVCASLDFDDVFNNPPLPRFEFWPHQMSQCVLPYTYVSRPPDLSDPGATLPRLIRGDVILELALAQAARWPGAAKDEPNPYFNLPLAMQHEARGQKMVADLARTDDELFENEVTYMSLSSMNIPAVAWGDSRWLQSHEGPY